MRSILKRIVNRVLFGKRKNYKKRVYYNYTTWHAHNALLSKVDNLIKHLKLKEVKSTGLIGEPKDAKKFDDQWSY